MPVSQYFQPATALAIGAAATDDARIARDLATALAALGPTPAKPPKAAHIARFIRDAVRAWTLTENRMPDALRITNAVPVAVQDHPAIVALRCRILRLMGDFAGALHEIERQCTRPGLAPADIEGLTLFCQRNGLIAVLCTPALAALGLEPPDIGDPAGWYCNPLPRPVDAPLPIDTAALAAYCQMSGRTPTPELRARLQVAELLFFRAARMNTWHGSVLRAGDTVADGVAHARAIRAAVQMARAKLVRADLAPIRRAIAEGRNVIVMAAHIGSGIVNLVLQDIDAERVIIARGDTPRPGFALLTTGNAANIGLKMLKLAKAMKQHRHLVLIAPDGPSGLDFAQVQVGGVPVRIGIGVAALARVHDCALFFARSIWQRDHFELELTEGAPITKGMEKAAATAAFVDLFTTGMHKALQGAPEDFAIATFLHTRNAGVGDFDE